MESWFGHSLCFYLPLCIGFSGSLVFNPPYAKTALCHRARVLSNFFWLSVPEAAVAAGDFHVSDNDVGIIFFAFVVSTVAAIVTIASDFKLIAKFLG